MNELQDVCETENLTFSNLFQYKEFDKYLNHCSSQPAGSEEIWKVICRHTYNKGSEQKEVLLKFGLLMGGKIEVSAGTSHVDQQILQSSNVRQMIQNAMVARGNFSYSRGVICNSSRDKVFINGLTMKFEDRQGKVLMECIGTLLQYVNASQQVTTWKFENSKMLKVLDAGWLSLRIDGNLKLFGVSKLKNDHDIDLRGTALEWSRMALTLADYSDVTLRCGNLELACHKVVLASRSEVFRTMFEEGRFREGQPGHPTVEIKEVTSKTLEVFIKFLYTGKIANLDIYASDLLPLSERYKVDALKEICSEYIGANLNQENVIDVMLLGHIYNAASLEDKAIGFAISHSTKIDHDSFIKNYPALLLKYTIALSEKLKNVKS